VTRPLEALSIETLRLQVEMLTRRLHEVEGEIERLELGTYRASFAREAAERQAQRRALEADAAELTRQLEVVKDEISRRPTP
jgi:ABC-type phosphate transport system auxiliary subunit